MKFDEPKAKRFEILQLLRKVSNETSGSEYYRYYVSDFASMRIQLKLR